jgi:hypothetical protein
MRALRAQLPRGRQLGQALDQRVIRVYVQRGPAGDLTADGAPRWKQRARYDAINDIGSTDGSGVSMARLSVYDQISDTTLGAALEQRASVSPNGVRELLEQRLAT